MSALRDSSKDLPLLSNTNDLIVEHYMINLNCDFKSRIFTGSVILFMKPVHSSDGEVQNKCFHSPASAESNEKDKFMPNTADDKFFHSGKGVPFFNCILDCCDINIKMVEEIHHEEEQLTKLLDFSTKNRYSYTAINEWSKLNRKQLSFQCSEWGLFIWKQDIFSKYDFPRVICISYATTLKGSSLTWTTDQACKQCVFTQGAWINNRSLFPCQEPPIAMATWQACVTVEVDAVVIMSGDEEPLILDGENGKRMFYYYTRMTLPMSTLALAIGFWEGKILVSHSESQNSNKKMEDVDKFECNHERFQCYLQQDTFPSLIPCRLFSPAPLLMTAEQEFKNFLEKCLEAAFQLLGPHPFSRLDILILPRCFGSLGLASPNVLFISQSLLAGSGSMNIRLAHEIAHSWFGLSIGALDWTEEWLSEGFATFLEDFIYSLATTQASLDCLQEECAELRSLLRYRILQAELMNTDKELQTLRPNFGEELREGNVVLVKNGMNPEKCFTQVHYLKGYFLLRYLSKLVGQEKFLFMIKKYVIYHHGCLVLSKNFFQLYFKFFPDSKVTIEQIYQEWLDYPGMPKILRGYEHTLKNNSLIKEVKEEFKKWKKLKLNFCRRKASKRRKTELQVFKELKSEQLVLLLEYLLSESKIPIKMLEKLKEVYRLVDCDSDVKHRWCELIIKHDYRKALEIVENFLIENQAMGVYLYGELVLTKKSHHRTVAEKCFEMLKEEMDSPARLTVEDLLYSNQ